MLLIDCKFNLDVNWSKNCITVASNIDKEATSSMTDTRPSTQDNTKLFEQLKSAFERTVNWNKYQSKIPTERQNQYLV